MTEIPIPEVPGPNRNGHTNWQRLQALLALVIALVAIALAAWEGIENRRHNRLSVQPRLNGEYDTGRAGDSEYVRLAVENTGLGPAVIRSIRMYLDGAEVTANLREGRSPWNIIIDSVASDSMRIDARAFGVGYFLPAGREYVLFHARRPRSRNGDTTTISDIANRIAVDLCYCSIYGSDCDRVTLTTRPIDVGTCPRQ